MLTVLGTNRSGGTAGKYNLYNTTVTMASLQEVFLSWNAIDVAQTAFNIPAIKKELVRFVLKEIDRECSLICFDGIGSVVSLITENQNLRERLREPAPLLLSVLDTAVTAIMKHPTNDKENYDVSNTKTVRKEAATIESTKNSFQNKACIRSTGVKSHVFGSNGISVDGCRKTGTKSKLVSKAYTEGLFRENHSSSIRRSIDQFLFDVNTMEATILVPTRLRHISEDHDLTRSLPTPLRDCDLKELFDSLKKLRTQFSEGKMYLSWFEDSSDQIKHAMVLIQRKISSLSAILDKLAATARFITEKYEEQM